MALINEEKMKQYVNGALYAHASALQMHLQWYKKFIKGGDILTDEEYENLYMAICKMMTKFKEDCPYLPID